MKKENRKSYPSDLTDRQWKEIEALYRGMRKFKWSKRKLTNAVLYLVDTGCKWRQLPHDFPPYSTVHSFYRRVRFLPKGKNKRAVEQNIQPLPSEAGRFYCD